MASAFSWRFTQDFRYILTPQFAYGVGALAREEFMQKIRVDLKNCYGIKDLKAEFDFSKGRAVAVYAPNGAMKSSFAETFIDVATGQASKDRVFPKRATSRTI